MHHKYRTIVADPPWPETGGGVKGGRRGADRHYPLMRVADIKAMADQVKALVSDEGCHLYLWTTNTYHPAAEEVMAAWGFKHCTAITWGKTNKDGSIAMGLGQYYRGATEHCLFGVTGRLPYRMTRDALGNLKRAQGSTLILAPRRKHSQKPDLLMDMAELVSHPPRIELFARSKRLGWDVWGNEVS